MCQAQGLAAERGAVTLALAGALLSGGDREGARAAFLGVGIPVHVVQRMAGHKHLSTTQRYVHYLKEDLEEAARRMAQAQGGAVVTRW
ncbi:hypothetical protein [Polyangium sp. 15x6]|uniref:hypothetical protein n=1 Tax=Polyangium sp. 15x6 TaxID=3042687 RepID=UPI00249A69BB|nr:hypothetical protein [Polyangium sp. 15x6]MDI3291598.1 hypothetical protein [Polyangium sp. 15x6]